MAVLTSLLLVRLLMAMAKLLILSCLLLEILQVIFPAHLLILVHELINRLHGIVGKLISLPQLATMLILSGVVLTSLGTTELLKALHATHIGSRLVWSKLALPIWHHVLLALILGLRNCG